MLFNRIGYMKVSECLICIILFCSFGEAFGQSSYSKGEKVVRYQCGACHIKSLPTANQGALKIFNLENSLWARPLTDKIREKIVFNIKERMNLSTHELSYLLPRGYKPLPKKPTKADVAAVKKFLDDEKNKPAKLSDYISF